MKGWWKDMNGKHDITLSGDWYKGTAVLWLPDSNQAIGKVVHAAQELDGNSPHDDYRVTVAPGVDLQVFAGIIIAVESLLTKELR